MSSPPDERSEAEFTLAPQDRGKITTFLVGLFFIASGAYAYYHMGRFLQTAQEASGTVIEVAYESTNKKGRMHPVVRFTTASGQAVTVRTEEHHNVAPGDTVRLIYDPRRPNDIEITTLTRAQHRRVLIAALSVAFGAFVCLLAVGLIVLPGS